MKYGKLTIIGMHSFKEYKSGRKKIVLCKCDCGNEKTIQMNHLKSGLTKSCGCICKDGINNPNRKHGMIGTRLYRCFRNIKSRCEYKKHKDYHSYGLRGIKCEWKSFEEFYEDMKEGYSDSLTIDRINVNGNYCKENCRWATNEEQQMNKRNTIFVEYKGVKYNTKEVQKVFGIPNKKFLFQNLSKKLPGRKKKKKNEKG